MRAERTERNPGADETVGPAHISQVSQVGEDEIIVPFDRYLLVRQLGEGAMGTVYEARQQEPARTVAVKVLKSKHSSASAEQRFFRETRLLASLNHPHVAQLYDAGVHRHGVLEVPYCVMELVRGASSITNYARARELNVRARIELFLQVCTGVRHAHEHDVIHCDLKPSNILVNGEGQAKVIDFGVARSLRLEESSGKSWSDASLIFGTPQYMSPEQARGLDFELDQRTDVYALGVVLYELLCGRLPYHVDRTSSITAARCIVESAPVPPRKLDRSLPRGVENILLKALSKDADHRYPSVAELELDLQRLLRGEPVAPDRRRWSRLARRSGRWIARHRLFSATIAITVATALGALGGSSISALGWQHTFDIFLTERIGHVVSAPLQHVTIVRIAEGTDFAALLSKRPTDRPDDVRFGRRAHGEFLKRLASAGVRARAVVFDIHFQGASDWDDDLVDGLRSLGDVPVFAVSQGDISASPPKVAPKLIPYLRVGGTAGLTRSDSPWIACLASTMRNGGIAPSLALLVVSHRWHGNEAPALEWTPDSLRLRYANAIEREVEVTSVTEMPDENPQLGLRQGTAFGEFMVEVPSDAHLQQSSLDYHDVFILSESRLRERLDGKIVLIGDFRPGADGPFPHPDGRALCGPVLQAVTIERLLNNDILKRPRFVAALGTQVTSAAFIVLLSSIAGGLVARKFSHRSVPRIVLYGTLGTAIVAASLLSFRLGGFIYSPVSALLCVVIGGELIAMIYRARESTI